MALPYFLHPLFFMAGSRLLSAYCLALGSSSSFPCAAFLAITKSMSYCFSYDFKYYSLFLYCEYLTDYSCSLLLYCEFDYFLQSTLFLLLYCEFDLLLYCEFDYFLQSTPAFFNPWYSDKIQGVIPLLLLFFVSVKTCFVSKYVVNFGEGSQGAEKKVLSCFLYLFVIS
ncbi:hypothetical protein STEG23_016218 [Scotinomys teguina]